LTLHTKCQAICCYHVHMLKHLPQIAISKVASVIMLTMTAVLPLMPDSLAEMSLNVLVLTRWEEMFEHLVVSMPT